MEATNKTNGITIHEMIFPMSNTIKVIDTKKGRRFYIGSQRQYRFLPLSKVNFAKLDQSKYEIYQEVAKGFIKIN